MYKTSNFHRNQYFSEAELKFMVIVLRDKKCTLLNFVPEMIKATSYIRYDDTGIYIDYEPNTIILKLLAMPHSAIVDLYTKLTYFWKFPDAHCRIIERLREMGLL